MHPHMRSTAASLRRRLLHCPGHGGLVRYQLLILARVGMLAAVELNGSVTKHKFTAFFTPPSGKYIDVVNVHTRKYNLKSTTVFMHKAEVCQLECISTSFILQILRRWDDKTV